MSRISYPEDWKTVTVGDACEFTSGNGFRPPDWSTEGLPIIRIQNLNGSTAFNYFKGEPESKWLVEPGTMLFAWAGTKGVSFGPTIWEGPVAVLNQHIFKVHPKTNVDKAWLFLILQMVTQRIEQNAHGFKATLVHVRKSDITQQVIPLPPLPEQRKIAQILSTWDEAIQVVEALIAALKARKRGLMQRLLTGEVRFPGFVESDETIETRFGDIPADWRYVPISEIARSVSAKNSRGADLPVLSCTKYDGLVDSLEYFGRQIYSEDTSTYKTVERNQFAYATNHIEEGSIGYQDLYDRALISPMYTVFETTGRINDSYLYKVLKTELYRHIFEVSTSASVNRRGSLRWGEFSKIPVPLPSLAEQRSIAEVIDSADGVIEQFVVLRDSLREQKRGLMQRLLTGEVRVKV